MGNYVAAYGTDPDGLSLWATTDDLIRLSNVSGEVSETVNADVVDKAIAAAEGVINTYVGKQYSVPLTGTIDPGVVDATVIIAVYKMRLARDRITEAWQQAYRDCIAWLDGIASGEVVLDTSGGSGTDPTPASFSYNARLFNRTRFQDW